MKNPFSRFFRARDKPGATDSVSSAPTFYFGSSAAGKSVTASTAIQMSTVYACVRVIAETIASLPLHVYQNQGEGSVKALEHPLYPILHDEPNSEMTSFVWRETMLAHLLLWGNAYCQMLHDALYGENGESSDDVRIILNSYGGSCNAAVRMHDDIRAYPGRVHLVISGTAASAATVLSAAADTLEMTPGSLYMIHDPSTVAWGNERDFSEAIALLKACKESILNIYSRRSPIDRGTLAAMMTATTWMDAGAALAQGFIDGVADPQTCPTDSAAVRTVNRKDAEAKVRLWLERHNPLKQGETATALKSAAIRPVTENKPVEKQPNSALQPEASEKNGIPTAQLRKRLDLIKPNDR